MSMASSLRKGLKFFLMSLGVSSPEKRGSGKPGLKISSPEKKPIPANEPKIKGDSTE
jgi:hypothetical protein